MSGTTRRILVALLALLLAPLAALHAAEPTSTTWHTPRTAYKCFYNVESLTHCNEDISAAKIKWVIEKLRGTDVDAIMCCPTALAHEHVSFRGGPGVEEVHAHPATSRTFQPYDHVMKYIH